MTEDDESVAYEAGAERKKRIDPNELPSLRVSDAPKSTVARRTGAGEVERDARASRALDDA